MKQRLMTLVNPVAVFVALLMLWELVLLVFRVPPYMLPSPLAVIRVAIRRFSSLWASSIITAEESAAGLMASLVF